MMIRLGLLVFTVSTLVVSRDVTGQWANDFSSAIPRMSTLAPSLGGSTWDSGGFGSADSLSFGSMRQDWRIGVGIDNRDIGAVVTQVQPGSAAQSAGIIPGDVIVTAGPLRLGLVDRGIVELADVARRYADPSGRISMLILDSRSGRLRNVIVNMTSTATAVSGALALRDNAVLPQGSVATIELRNASRQFFDIQGGRTNLQISGYGPFSYSLNVDQRFLSPADQYEIRAAIYVNNQPVYVAQPIRLRFNELSQPINLILERGNLSNVSLGGTISAGYSSNELIQELQNLLGRVPNTQELGAWSDFLRAGKTVDDMRQRILSNHQLRTNFGSDAIYMQHVYRVLKGQIPSQNEITYWMGRLRATSPEIVISEMMRR